MKYYKRFGASDSRKPLFSSSLKGRLLNLSEVYYLSAQNVEEIFLLVNLTLQVLCPSQLFCRTVLCSLLQTPAYQISHRQVLEAP